MSSSQVRRDEECSPSLVAMSKEFRLRPVIPYHMAICTGLERDAGTTSRAYVIIVGADHAQTQRLWLDRPDGRTGFQAGSLERFESHGSDVGEIKKVEVREGRRGERRTSGAAAGSRLKVASFPACSSAMTAPLLRAAGWWRSCLSPCQPKGSNTSLPASAGWPKTEETG